jgi:hypothetical protein
VARLQVVADSSYAAIELLAACQGAVRMDKVELGGCPNCNHIRNKSLQLVLLQIKSSEKPRIEKQYYACVVK